MICQRCLKEKRIHARGLCSRCYEIERTSNGLEKYKDNRYRNGLTKTICEQCGKEFESYSTSSGARKYCSRSCYEISERVTNKNDNKRIIELHSSGLSASKISLEFNVSNSTITNILKRNGLSARPNWSYARKYNTNEFAFDSLDNEQSAYWLGFIYADGYVGKDALQMVLKAEDVAHLILLSKFMNSEQNPKPNKTNGYTIAFHGAHLIERLKNLGIVPRRSSFDKVLNELPQTQYCNFIRGYLDGDGYITKIDTRYTVNVGFLGQDDILGWIKTVLFVNCQNIGNPQIKQRRGIKELAFGGARQAICILKWLYADATIYLPRKYERAMYWINK